MRGRPSAERAARSFKPRGRLTAQQRQYLESDATAILVAPSEGGVDWDRVFGRAAPLVVDVGFGDGGSTLHYAARHRDVNIVGIDVHRPGIANIARAAALEGLAHVRVVAADALDALRYMFAEDSVDLVQVAFPDPWPKPVQRHRRLVDEAFVALVAGRLAAAGELRLATDVDDYAAQMLAVTGRCAVLRNPHGGYAPRFEERPVTRFERRAIRENRVVRDLVVRKVGPMAASPGTGP